MEVVVICIFVCLCVCKTIKFIHGNIVVRHIKRSVVDWTAPVEVKTYFHKKLIQNKWNCLPKHIQHIGLILLSTISAQCERLHACEPIYINKLGQIIRHRITRLSSPETICVWSKQKIHYDDIWYTTGFPDDYVVTESSRHCDGTPIETYRCVWCDCLHYTRFVIVRFEFQTDAAQHIHTEDCVKKKV